jgi:serine/threonine protein kinase
MSQETLTTAVALTPGAQLGAYQLIRELGVGGMGQVFLAEDSRLERKVALKFLTAQLAQNEEFRQRFLREARSAAKLNHNNIVTVYEVGEETDHVYISMEYVEGRSLRELIDTRALSYDQALETFTQLCTGLKKAHDTGIVHRDLKPANVMVTGDNEVKILDFGLAKGLVDGNLTSTGTALGTVNYMSPEQAQGTQADQRSDLFSAGILLFEILSGVNPFVRGYMPATIHAIVYEPAGLLSSHMADLPSGCQIIIDKALAKRPDDRYQSIDEFLADLARLKAGQDITPAAVAQPSVARSDKPSLAVLHLRNLGSEDDEFLTYGITEDLIVDLSRVGSFKVMPMYKILKYKDSELDPGEIARQLNVSLILDGSIHRSNKSVRVSAQLVDVSKDDIVWSNRWEVGADELARIKSALAEGISGALSIDSSVLRKAEVGKAETSNPEAYDHYLKGKFAFEKRKKQQDIVAARGHFQKALELDSSLLLARVGLARIHVEDGECDQAIDVLKPALTEARRRNLRGDEARILVAMGEALNLGSDFKASAERHESAMLIFQELSDVDGEAEALGKLLSPYLNMGQPQRVLEFEPHLGKLIEAGADRTIIAEGLSRVAVAHDLTGNSNRALEIYEDGLQAARAGGVKSFEGRTLNDLAEMYSERGGRENMEIATAYLEEARLIAERLGDRNLESKVVGSEAWLLLTRGMFRMALQTLVKLLVMLEESKELIGFASSHQSRALVHYLLGEYDQAIEWADRGYEMGDDLEGGYRHAILALCQMRKALALTMSTGPEAALPLLDEITEESEASGITWCRELALAVEGETLFYAGDMAGARKALEQVLSGDDTPRVDEVKVYSIGHLGLIDMMEGNAGDALPRLRDNARQAEGHFSEVAAKRALGHALLEYSDSAEEKSEGRRVLMQALGLARQQECVPEITRIQAVLERNE